MPITAVRTTAFKIGPTGDVDLDGFADPGDILAHSLIITNTEAFALTGLTIEETLAGITTVPGSVQIGPIANDDTFNMVGNTSILLTKAQLIGNDIDPDGAEANMIVTINLASDVNGTIVDNGNNTYTFTPDIGFEGDATFTYSLTDEQGVTSVAGFDGKVTLDVEDVVWFIDNNAGGSTNVGTQANPFTSIAAFNAVNDGVGINHPAANDYVYLREGTGTYSGADGINLLNGQILTGQGENLVVNNSVAGNIIVETGTAGDTPVIVVTGGAGNQGIQLASGNTISGLDVGMSNAAAVGIADGGGTVGALVISNVAVGTAAANTGAAIDIDQGGTLNVQLDSIRSTDAGTAIDLGSTTGLAGTGNGFTVSGTTLIEDATADSIAIANSSLNATFTGKVTVLNDLLGANADGVDMTTNTGTYSFNGGVDITVNGTGAFGFRAQGSGTVNITNDPGATQIISNNGTAILINPTTVNASLDTVTSGGGAQGISLTSMSGSLTIGTATINGQTGNGISVATSTGSLTINGGSVGNTNDPGGDAVNISGGSGAVTINASLTTSSGNVVDISNHATGAINFGGAISATGAGTGINLVNNASGAINFTNAAVNLNTSSGTALNFTNTAGTGADVSFSGGNLNIDTSSGAGINATSTTTGAGSLTIGGAALNNSVVTTGGGRAITIDGVTSHVQLHDVFYSGGAGNTAIFLKNTGASGDFAITGTGSTANSGGVIAMNAGGGDGATIQGIGVYLENAANISLSNLDFNGTFSNFGIRGLNVNNFTLRDSELSAGATFGTLSNVTTGEGVIKFGSPGSAGTTGLSGTALLEGNVIGNGRFDNVAIWNYGTNALTLTIQDSASDQAVFNANQAFSDGNDSLFVETGGTQDLIMTVNGVQFTGVIGDHIQTNATGQNGSSQNITISNNNFSQTLTDAVAAGGGIRVGGGSTVAGTDLDVDFLISNNVMTGSKVSTMDLRFNGLEGDINGVVLNNQIGTANGTYSSSLAQRGAGSNGAYGIWAGVDRNATVAGDFLTLNYAMRIEGNTIRDTNAGSILVWSNNGGGEGTVRTEVSILNNTMAEYFQDGLGNGALSGVYFQVGGSTAGDDALLGVRMLNNTVNASTATDGVAAAIFDQNNDATSHFYIPGIPGAPLTGNGTAAVNNGISNYWTGAPNNNILTNPTTNPGPPFVYAEVTGLTGEAFSLAVPIMAAPQPGEDWETAIHDWLANYQPPTPPTGDTGSGGGGGGGDGGSGSGDGGDGGPGDPPPPPEPPHPVIVDDGVLSQAELDYFVESAIQHWTDAGATAAQIAEMRATAISVVDMSGTYLGTSDATSIRVDSDGAGHGWFLDRTPGDNAEYQGAGSRLTADSGPAAGKMDLLTVLMHELGHQVGLDDLYDSSQSGELMYGYANLGERRLPQADDLANADTSHSSHESFLLAPTLIGTLNANKAVKILWESVVDTFSNQLIPNPFGFFSQVTGTNFAAFNSNTQNLVVDSLTLTGTIWNDNGAGGGIGANGTRDGTEAGIDGVLVSLFVDADDNNVADTPGTALATTTTAGGGNYSFTNLAEGTYVVRIDQDNFDAGGNTSLVATPFSPITSPEPFDPDNNVNNDDNGARTVGQPAWSNAITLNYNSETVDDGTGQFDINDTLDFGFVGLNSAPVNTVGGDVNLDEDDVNVGLSGMSVTDAEANPATDDIIVTLSVGDGTLDISTIVVGGVTAGDVTGDGTDTISITATQNEINATLAAAGGLTYSPDANFFGTDILTMTSNDNGFTGTDPGLTGDATSEEDIDTRNLIVASVNDAPEGADDTITAALNLEYVFASPEFGFSDPVDGDDFLAVIFTGVTGGALFYDAGADGFDPGDEITIFPQSVLVTEIDAGRVAFVPDTAGTGTGTVSFQVQDDGTTANGGVDTDPSANTLTFNVVVPDPPVLSDFGGDVSTFTEGGAAVLLDDSSLPELAASLADNQTDLDGGSLTVSVTANGVAAEDVLGISTAGTVTLSSGTSVGSIVSVGGLAIGTISSDGNGGDDLVIDFDTADATPANITALVRALTYANSNNGDPSTLARTVQVSIDDGELGIETESVTVNVVGIDDEPTLAATGQDPTYSEGGASADLFGTVSASTVEAGQTFTSLTLTVSNVTDGAAEVLTVDGTDVELTNGNSIAATATNGLAVNVSVAAGLATVNVTGGTLSEAALETLVDALSYRNTSEDPTDADRVVTITSLSDDGSSTVPNDNTAALSIASTVDVEPVDDPGTAVDDNFNVDEDDLIDDGDLLANDTELDDPLQVFAVNGSAGNVGTQIALGGGLLTVNSTGLFDFDPDGNYGYLISAATALATGAVNTSTDETFTYDLVNGAAPATVTITIDGVDSADDELWGDSGNNTITDTVDIDYFNLSQGGNDTASGQAGADTFYLGVEFTDLDQIDGGAGNDTLILDGDYFASTLVFGPTTLVSVERIVLIAGNSYDLESDDATVAAGALLTIDGSGLGALDEILFDGSNELDGKFVLIGGGCDDELIGGNQGDILWGGADFNMLDGRGGIDRVDYTYATGPVDVDLDAGLANDNGDGGSDLLVDIENVTGSAFADVLVGDGNANTLDGGGGADQMDAGDGNDTYIVNNTGDVATEASSTGGSDTVRSSVTYTIGANIETLILTGTSNINGTGNGDNNLIFGNDGNNTLDGAGGLDNMRGGLGNDTYIIDQAGDVAVETDPAGGLDTVKSSLSIILGSNLEVLVLTGTADINGTGNALNNTMTGNSGKNLLNGVGGVDSLRGGDGDDTYVVSDVGDQAIETNALAAGGNDLVKSSINFILGANIEALQLTGGSAINGTGNGLDNVITGNAAANTLNGGVGADTMIGGLGDDIYFVDNAGDQAIETSAGGGTDLVQANVTFTLGLLVENLTLTGTGAIDGTGNAMANTINGNGNNNVLDGGANADTINAGGGADTLWGGLGIDTLNASAGNDKVHGGLGNDILSSGSGTDEIYFDTALNAFNNVDAITDFSSIGDTIFLDDAIFTSLATGALAAGAFRAGSAALDADDRILYDSATGHILFDADGAGGTAAILFATVAPATIVTAADFIVF